LHAIIHCANAVDGAAVLAIVFCSKRNDGIIDAIDTWRVIGFGVEITVTGSIVKHISHSLFVYGILCSCILLLLFQKTILVLQLVGMVIVLLIAAGLIIAITNGG